MKLHSAQLERLSQGLVSEYRRKDFIVVRSDDEALKGVIADVLRGNFEEEEKIENEARALLESHAGEGRDVDSHKALLLIKQRLAEKRGFVL